jgi:hypothetical protein
LLPDLPSFLCLSLHAYEDIALFGMGGWIGIHRIRVCYGIIQFPPIYKYAKKKKKKEKKKKKKKYLYLNYNKLFLILSLKVKMNKKWPVLLFILLISVQIFSDNISFSGDSMQADLASGRERTILTGNAYLKTDDTVIYADRIEL